MKRYAISRLLEWKNSMNRKPLLMYGARQVGKTWLIRDFAKNNYDLLIKKQKFLSQAGKGGLEAVGCCVNGVWARFVVFGEGWLLHSTCTPQLCE